MVRGLGFFYAATLGKGVTERLKVTVSKTVEEIPRRFESDLSCPAPRLADHHGGVAQLARAPVSKTGGSEFESLRPRHRRKASTCLRADIAQGQSS